jgi:hypothetical protein
MSTAGLSANYMIDVHLTLICATYLTEATIALKYTLSLLAVSA